MADPIYDQITSATLKDLRNDALYDNLFKDNSFTEILYQKSFYICLKADWEKAAAKRMAGMGIDITRVLVILEEMRASGNFESDTNYEEIRRLDYGRIGYSGGDGIQEPLSYDQSGWDGNSYATYGGINRKK